MLNVVKYNQNKISTESNVEKYQGIRLLQDNFDDGIQTLYCYLNGNKWIEKRHYENQRLEVFSTLKDNKVDDNIIYSVIQYISDLRYKSDVIPEDQEFSKE